MRNAMRNALVSVAAATCVLACGGDDSVSLTGSASLSWQIGARTCDEVGVETIRIRAAEGGRMDAVEVACEQRRVDLEGLRPGVYRFRLDGLDAQGLPRYQAVSEAVEVRASGRVNVPSAVLSARHARLILRWTFGGPLCSQAGVRDVHVHVFDRFGFEEVHEQIACDAGEIEIDVRPGAWDVLLHGVTPEGAIGHTSHVPVELRPGEVAQRTTVLEKLPSSP